MPTLHCCPKCGKQLIKSNIKGYALQCLECDEDFYRLEVITIETNKHMEEVTKEQFYNTVGQLDIVLKVIGDFPYTTEFRLRYGALMGKVVDDYKDGIKNQYPIISRYYVNNKHN